MGILDRVFRHTTEPRRQGGPRVTVSIEVNDDSAARWAAMSPQERREEKARSQEALRIERLAAGGATAARERRGHVRGKHYTEWPDTVRDLKREERHGEALDLLFECIDAAERDRDGREPAPWYTEQAAIIFRKGKDYAAEIAVLERYQKACPRGQRSETVDARLMKARQFLSKSTR